MKRLCKGIAECLRVPLVGSAKALARALSEGITASLIARLMSARDAVSRLSFYVR